ncbi:MAG: HIT domain-containing protein [Candidatus Aenigmatarchaeota archaeon]
MKKVSKVNFMIESWIFANRMRWLRNKKVKYKECLFCKVVRGEEKAKILFRDKDLFVMMNKFPYNTGHLMVAPTKHIKSLEDLSDEEIKKLFVIVKRCVKILKISLKPVGFNIGINMGKYSGASIENHLHIHIVPRFKTDFGFMEVVSKTKVIPESLNKTFERLIKHKEIFEKE